MGGVTSHTHLVGMTQAAFHPQNPFSPPYNSTGILAQTQTQSTSAGPLAHAHTGGEATRDMYPPPHMYAPPNTGGGKADSRSSTTGPVRSHISNLVTEHARGCCSSFCR